MAALTPRKYRVALALLLLSNYKSLPDYIYHAARGIVRTTAVGAVEAFDPKLRIGDLACVFIAFHDMHHLTALIGVLAVSTLVLTWRDGYTNPPSGAGTEAAIDAFTLQGCLLVWTIVCNILHSTFAAPVMEIIVEGIFAMGFVGGWRFAWRSKNEPEPEPHQADVAYVAAKRINYLWYTAIWILTMANAAIVAATGHMLGFLFVAPTLILIQVAERLQSERTGGRLHQQLTTIWNDPKKQKRYDRSNRLFIKPLFTKHFTSATFVEGLFWVLLATPLLYAFIGWRLGYFTTDQIDFILLLGNCGIYALLATLWRELKNVNRRVFLALRADCEG